MLKHLSLLATKIRRTIVCSMPQEHSVASRQITHKHVRLVRDLPHANARPWQEERRCSLSRGSHAAPKSSVVVCHHCHSSRCYKHILSAWHVHSAQALKAHLADATSTLWHQLHKDMKAEYTKDYPQLKARIRGGFSYALFHRLSYYASRFAPTAPLNQAVSLGFYDMPDAETNVVFIPHFVVHWCFHSPAGIT